MHVKTSEFSATDIANFLACRHLQTLERSEEAGEVEKPFFYDPGVELLQQLGLRHEQTYLRHLTDTQGLQVVHIPTDVSWANAVSRTIDAIRSGAGAVYQATFQDGAWRGRADFLVRVNRPSELGDFSYEVIETKLARAAKVRAILQLCFYSELLAKIQVSNRSGCMWCLAAVRRRSDFSCRITRPTSERFGVISRQYNEESSEHLSGAGRTL
jgi:predicted RecB family nuclease